MRRDRSLHPAPPFGTIHICALSCSGDTSETRSWRACTHSTPKHQYPFPCPFPPPFFSCMQDSSSHAAQEAPGLHDRSRAFSERSDRVRRAINKLDCRLECTCPRQEVASSRRTATSLVSWRLRLFGGLQLGHARSHLQQQALRRPDFHMPVHSISSYMPINLWCSGIDRAAHISASVNFLVRQETVLQAVTASWMVALPDEYCHWPGAEDAVLDMAGHLLKGSACGLLPMQMTKSCPWAP